MQVKFAARKQVIVKRTIREIQYINTTEIEYIYETQEKVQKPLYSQFFGILVTVLGILIYCLVDCKE